MSSWDVAMALVPMDRAFGHATANRTSTASVLVQVRSGDLVGWGEGAPRRYVTGETVETAAAQLRELDLGVLSDLIGPGSFESRVRRLAAFAGAPLTRMLGRGRPAASAAAALELALLDLVCRAHDRPLRDVLPLLGLSPGTLRDVPAPVVPSLVVDLRHDPATVLGQLPAATRARLQHVKVKVDADLDKAVRRAAVTRVACRDVTVSLDANGVWDPARAVQAAPRLRDAGVDWVEEPFPARDWVSLRRLTRTGLGVMLDESLQDDADLRLAARLGAASHVNIRISKCGGLIAAARLIDLARRNRLHHQLGVQVGEIGPLWAAGRTLGCQLIDPCAVETGRQDEWFTDPLTEPAFPVDRSGPMAPPLAGVGSGIAPSPRLRRELISVPGGPPHVFDPEELR